ncbi:phosphoglycerate mutase-like protein [Hyaloscypha variabilis F]|uniref:Phosphoglycerate mutase-like protein n=1 Tax=Hyaloscypha variabilis (strain UAMH 11265 / GT02V1 / F) TaxID=1149755 RepID=A0A2J6R0E4_HYAVF|nr:phosphoglycerate mutase-like protein [Hyaloscypha variabilis F]
MPPTLILIRHAEGIHNFTVHDPPLTSLGLEIQCAALSAALKSHPLAPKISLIVTSPLTRTLQTTTSLSFLTSRGVPIIALPFLQETTNNNIDIGTPASILSKTFPSVDFSLVEKDEIWPRKEGLYAYQYEALIERGKVARNWLKERKEEVIAVVGHDGFLRVGLCGKKFGNADFRIFEFEEGEGDQLVEWESTEKNGGVLGTCPKGSFGWVESDFKYMPHPPSEDVIRAELAETERMAGSS